MESCKATTVDPDVWIVLITTSLLKMVSLWSSLLILKRMFQMLSESNRGIQREESAQHYSFLIFRQFPTNNHGPIIFDRKRQDAYVFQPKKRFSIFFSPRMMHPQNLDKEELLVHSIWNEKVQAHTKLDLLVEHSASAHLGLYLFAMQQEPARRPGLTRLAHGSCRHNINHWYPAMRWRRLDLALLFPNPLVLQERIAQKK